MTLQEYQAQKKKTNFKKEARKPEEIKKTGIERVEKTTQKVEGKSSQLKNNELYSISKPDNAEILGF